MPTLVILLPALNEELTIGPVLTSIPHDRLNEMGIATRVLVVDGCSSDRTLEVARQYGADVLVQPAGGKGSAVRHGLAYSRADMVLVMDADGTYPAADIPILARHLQDGADLVIGSRLAGYIEPDAMSQLNLAGNRLLSRIATGLFGVQVSDVCSGMWGLTSEALSKIQLHGNGFDMEAELFAKACSLGLNIHEVPIRYSSRIGTSKLNPFIAGPTIALRLISSWIAGRREG